MKMLRMAMRISILIITLGWLMMGCNPVVNNVSEAEIYLLKWDDCEHNFANIMRMDVNGDQQALLDRASGSLDWSKDGKYLAAGCGDKQKLCIYERGNFIDWSKYPPTLPTKRDYVELDLPYECKSVMGDYGISSLSWAKDGDKLAVVCGTRERSTVCILRLDETSSCWEPKAGYDVYSKADWSPTGDVLVIDSGLSDDLLPDPEKGWRVERNERKIKIVDKEGRVITSLLGGWSPSWSHDAKWIAFFRWSDESGYPGIGAIKPDGTGFHWIYQPPFRGSDTEEEYYHPKFVTIFDTPFGASRISWSEDDKYIITEAGKTGYYCTSIFKFEVATGEITHLLTNIGCNYEEPTIITP